MSLLRLVFYVCIAESVTLFMLALGNQVNQHNSWMFVLTFVLAGIYWFFSEKTA